MNNTDLLTITLVEHEGFYYVVTSNGLIGKGCVRCGGTGHYSFDGFDSICYNCRNVWSERIGDTFHTEEEAQKWCHGRALAKARRDAQQERKRLAKLAERDSAWQALKDSSPAVWELLSNVAGVSIPFNESAQAGRPDRSSFVNSMANLLWNLDEKPLTAKMVSALEDLVAKRAEEQSSAAEAPAGRVVVTGEVASTRIVESDFGIGYKMLVKADEGFKVWVSIPMALLETTTLEEAVGRRVTFTATLNPSEGDKSFAFGSRPSKAVWL